ncbi:DUF3939 domain-containing protein [Paenibacillus brevis]|uniref:DUF3939 domain-containing protein n=1 Tax=Paenibacillus brevis TaxID=2841508 RepID=A0ABS6FTD3_9BACL|nr:DUF3939 domain-containing protein [Paenibacillus brevis]MBU5672752.1 DUF3939 domain-containing protein [Paenibacillus brevis]
MHRNHCASLVKIMLAPVALAILLSGCLYREAVQQNPSDAYRESVNRIQLAVDQYQSEHELLPLITPSEETPKYEKFRIDLALLLKQGYLESIPQAAFENGGSVYFLIQNEELDPVIKIMDLTTVQYVNDVERLAAKYREQQGGALPVEKENGELPEGIRMVDLKAIGGKDYVLKSVYSGQELNYLINDKGKVYVDYAPDLMQIVERTGITPSDDYDIREMLTEQSYFVPVKSLPYFWEDNRPIPQPE